MSICYANTYRALSTQLKTNVVLCVSFQTMSWLTEANKRRWVSIDVDPLRCMSRLCSALPVLHVATDCFLRDVDDREGLLLSPFPFRSLELNKKDDTGCLDGRRVGVLRR